MFVVGLVVLLGIYTVLSRWMTDAERQYIDAYRSRHLTHLSTSTQRVDRALARSDWFKRPAHILSARLVNLLLRRQSEPELERLRRHAVARWLVAGIGIMASWAVFMIVFVF